MSDEIKGILTPEQMAYIRRKSPPPSDEELARAKAMAEIRRTNARRRQAAHRRKVKARELRDLERYRAENGEEPEKQEPKQSEIWAKNFAKLEKENPEQAKAMLARHGAVTALETIIAQLYDNVRIGLWFDAEDEQAITDVQNEIVDELSTNAAINIDELAGAFETWPTCRCRGIHHETHSFLGNEKAEAYFKYGLHLAIDTAALWQFREVKTKHINAETGKTEGTTKGGLENGSQSSQQ